MNQWQLENAHLKQEISKLRNQLAVASTQSAQGNHMDFVEKLILAGLTGASSRWSAEDAATYAVKVSDMVLKILADGMSPTEAEPTEGA